jgi:glutathione S-transferase
MKNTIKIYGSGPYDRGAKARWLLTEMGVDFETTWLDVEGGALESPEFRKINPLGRVPAVEINGRAMFESGAICTYLADLYPEKGMAPKLNTPERMQYEQWMYFTMATLDVFMSRMMIIEDIAPGPVFQTKMETLLSDVETAFAHLDSVLSKNQFLVGNRLTAADISVSYHLFWCTFWPEFKTIIDQNKNLSSFLSRMRENPSARKVEVFSYVE